MQILASKAGDLANPCAGDRSNLYQQPELRADLVRFGDQPPHHVISQDEDIRLNGLPAKSVNLTGDSPIQGPGGHPLLERDRLITFLRNDGTLFYVIFVSPDRDARQLAPTFDKMQSSLRVY